MIGYDQLSDVAQVGIGLYLALSVIQIVGGEGLLRLRKNIAQLESIVEEADDDELRSELQRVKIEIFRSETSLSALSRTFLSLLIFLLFLSVWIFLVIISKGSTTAPIQAVYLLPAYYLATPFLLFWTAQLIVKHKPGPAKRKCDVLYRQVMDAL